MRPRPRAWLIGAIAGLSVGWLISHSGIPETPVAKAAPEPDPRELYTIVATQIEAIRRGDFPAAYQFAALGIQKQFPVGAFQEMVIKTYPQLSQSRHLNFGQAQFTKNSHASALIYVSDGRNAAPMIYAFIKENGKWKIEGVQLLQTLDADYSGPET